MPVAEMLKRMSSAEITEWMALYKVRAEEAEARKNGGQNVWKPPEI
jgi:hypothetical protein